MSLETKEGIDGIYYLLDKLADGFEKNPGMILSLISYMISLPRPPAPFPLKKVERQLLYPNFETIDQVELLS
ncbi:hypothetical protein, partial [Fulvivirga aurantia]|uniref:hypothetical protein n=1 Tax=Fulvivirga aurantia TaxID=2529383 RepID=UPI001CA460B6